MYFVFEYGYCILPDSKITDSFLNSLLNLKIPLIISKHMKQQRIKTGNESLINNKTLYD